MWGGNIAPFFSIAMPHLFIFSWGHAPYTGAFVCRNVLFPIGPKVVSIIFDLVGDDKLPTCAYVL